MEKESAVKLSREEITALNEIAGASAKGKTTATEAIESKRLVSLGYVAKDATGHLAITMQGREVLADCLRKP
jgi:Mn-dependent DtxR family transcriptional regulator